MLGMDMPHAHALFSHSTGPYSARRSGKARATPSVGKIFAPCMIPGTSTQKKGLHPASFSAKSMHFAQTLPGRPPFSCNQRKEDTWRANLATAAKSPNTKATPTRPLFLAARNNTQINLSPRQFPQGRQSSQHETISKAAQHQGSLEKSCLRKLIRRSSMST